MLPFVLCICRQNVYPDRSLAFEQRFVRHASAGGHIRKIRGTKRDGERDRAQGSRPSTLFTYGSLGRCASGSTCRSSAAVITGDLRSRSVPDQL
jgi:hypothetical protein